MQALERPLSIELVRDGGAYSLPATRLHQTNLFLKVGAIDDLFLKVPSERGLDDYRNFVKLGLENPEDIRTIEERERFEKVEATLAAFPGMPPLIEFGAETAHYLAVHKIQYERLQQQTAVGIPRARFGVARFGAFGMFRRVQPAFFQERIQGTTLWNMYDFEALQVAPQWQRFRAAISAQLSGLLDSHLLSHVDWNIQNFVFEESNLRLFYVDLKPSTFLARQSNMHNLKGIRDYFIV